MSLTRMLADQSEHTKNGIQPKDVKKLSAKRLQNPSEPDATYEKR